MFLKNKVSDIWEALISSPSEFGQDDLLSWDFEKDATSQEMRRHFFYQCAVDNRFPSIAMLWLTLGMESLMTFFYFIQPYVTSENTFFPQHIYLYTSMILFCIIMIVLLKVCETSPRRLLIMEWVILFVTICWSAVFSALDILNGYSSYLYIQILIILSLLFRGSPLQRCLINTISFIVYLTVLLTGLRELQWLFAELINPFFMYVISCAIILINDRIQFKYFCDRKHIQKQHTLLEYYANYDYLTQVPNRKNILEHLEAVLEQRQDTSCMMVDVDNFKVYNDTCGHIQGDQCLIRIALIMKDVADQHGGQIGRYGGDEFFVVLSGKADEEALAIAEEFVKAVKDANIVFEDGDLMQITLSVGVATCRQKQTTPSALIQNADRALYQAKKQGKNRACLYA